MPRADAQVAQLVRETLTPRPITDLVPGQRVLCFQPPETWDRPEYLFCKSRILNNPLERSTGWWIGTVASVDTSGNVPWALVTDRNGKTWDYDGNEFPVYPLDQLPGTIAHIFQISDDLGALLHPPRPRNSGSRPRPPRNAPGTPPGPDLENEFFSRGNGNGNGNGDNDNAPRPE